MSITASVKIGKWRLVFWLTDPPRSSPPYPWTGPEAPLRGKSSTWEGGLTNWGYPPRVTEKGICTHTYRHLETSLLLGIKPYLKKKKKCIPLPLANVPSSSYHSSGASRLPKGNCKQAYQKLPHHSQCGLLAGTVRRVCGNSVRGNEVTTEIQFTPETGSG